MGFIVLVEFLRNVIRPLTLSVRLAANMVAGHLLLTLLRGLGSQISFRLITILFIGLIFLMILESAVALIQSYVFGVLSSLYLEEVNSLNIT